jgi:alpha-L-arabinofuranosidase
MDGGTDGRIETGRWYDIRIEAKGPSIDAFLDGLLVFKNANCYEELDLRLLEMGAARDNRTREIVLKAVNFSPQPQKALVKVRGIEGGVSVISGTMTVLTSERLEDENTVEEPTRVAPVTRGVTGLKPEFEFTFERASLTVLRLKAS